MSEIQTKGFSHAKVETNNFLMIVLILLVLVVGGLVEIVPLFFQKSTTQPVPGLQPYTALQLAGRDVYVREGCYNCHSQMIRPFRSEVLRYGQPSLAGESVYDHPFQWGSKRTGPDLARVGGRYSDEWHRVHLNNPRDVVPESNMPAYPWLETNMVNAQSIGVHMTALRRVGVPYTDAQIAASAEEVKGKTEMQAVIAYLQGLGTALAAGQAAPVTAAAGNAAAAVAIPVASTAAPLADAAGAEAPLAPATVPDDQAGVVLDNGVVKFYFASGKVDLATQAPAAMADAVAAAKAGKTLQVSGFSDATGNAAANAELSKQRAFAVRDALVAAGVPADKIDLVKPNSITGDGAAQEARRVELSVR